MRHWSQLGTRNWWVRPARTCGALAAIALGVGVVVWVTCAYESVRQALGEQVWFWIGSSDLTVEPYALDGTMPEALVDDVRKVPNVKALNYRLSHPASVFAEEKDKPSTRPGRRRFATQGKRIELLGLLPELEAEFRRYDDRHISGRMLTADDRLHGVIDATLALEMGVGLGDVVSVRNAPASGNDVTDPRSLEIELVGLFHYRRIARQQRPVIMVLLREAQTLLGEADAARKISRIDVMLEDASAGIIRKTEADLRKAIPAQYHVSSAETKRAQVEAADRQTRFVLQMFSSVALVTAFFVILSTLSMSVVERVAELGTLRCLGVTRIQMAGLVLGEAAPLSAVGILLGIPVGWLLLKLSVLIAKEYVGYAVLSGSGLLLAMAGGAGTTLLGALLPMIQAMRVSPLAASRPESRPPHPVLIWISALLGLGMVATGTGMIYGLQPTTWVRQLAVYPPLVIVLLCCGYALMTPALIRTLGVPAVRVAAALLRVRGRLLADQVSRAPWRSSAICCGLMVGLSLIVTLAVHSESLARGWDFPKQFADSFVFITPPAARDKVELALRTEGIAKSAQVNSSIGCTVFGQGLLHFPLSRFIAGDPDDFFDLVQLEFIEGNRDDAIARLKQGKHVLVTPEFARVQRVGLGDQLRIKMTGLLAPSEVFTIAGVVKSPALDLAANYFNASGRLVAASIHMVMGTLDDAEKVFGVPREVSLFLVNFDLAPSEPPALFAEENPPKFDELRAFIDLVGSWSPAMPERNREVGIMRDWYQRRIDEGIASPGWSDVAMATLFREGFDKMPPAVWETLTPAQRWRNYREELVMRLVAGRSGAAWEDHASAQALKAQIDSELKRATRLFSSIPVVALLVAALGVGNLMMTNVASRRRQIATLRALGATRWQVVRLVIGEALVLGGLGSLAGVALGLHAAWGLSVVITSIWGYEPVWTIPYGWVAQGVGFTIAVCILAGAHPARRAGQTNVIDALQTT